MSYAKVTVRTGGPNGDIVAEYTDVTDFTLHDNYVSFKHGPNQQLQTVPTATYWISGE